MPCSFVIPKKGHQKAKTCGEIEHKDGLCVAHQPKPPTVAVTPVTLSWQPMTASGTTSVNEKFQSACNAAATRIESVCLNGVHPGGMAFTGNKGAHQLLHDTQPGVNSTFFYRWQGSMLVVYGVGGHTGKDNKHYSLTWFDGSSAAVDLMKKKIT